LRKEERVVYELGTPVLLSYGVVFMLFNHLPLNTLCQQEQQLLHSLRPVPLATTTTDLAPLKASQKGHISADRGHARAPELRHGAHDHGLAAVVGQRHRFTLTQFVGLLNPINRVLISNPVVIVLRMLMRVVDNRVLPLLTNPAVLFHAQLPAGARMHVEMQLFLFLLVEE